MNKYKSYLLTLTSLSVLLMVLALFAVDSYYGKKESAESAHLALELQEETQREEGLRQAEIINSASAKIEYLKAWKPFLEEDLKMTRVQQGIYMIGQSRDDANSRVEVIIGGRTTVKNVIGSRELTVSRMDVTAKHEDLTRLFNFLGRVQEQYPQAKVYSLKFSQGRQLPMIPEVSFVIGFVELDFDATKFKLEI